MRRNFVDEKLNQSKRKMEKESKVFDREIKSFHQRATEDEKI
jgi:hypothetical protein